jgi:hypothetical protein
MEDRINKKLFRFYRKIVAFGYLRSRKNKKFFRDVSLKLRELDY